MLAGNSGEGRLRKFFSLPGRMKMLALESWVLQLVAGLVLKILPFRKITSLFATVNGNGDPENADLVQDISKALVYTERYSPWKNVCLVESMAARWMLNRRGIPSRCYLGVTTGQNGKMAAHAWIIAAGREVVAKNGSYLELYFF
jgi:hypothetical protein